jgi:cyd operon protein YbgT
MWYFSWILGIGVALAFGIINVMWLESRGAPIAVKPTKTR